MIVASAIKFYTKDDTEHVYPVIMTGKRHPDIFEKMFGYGIQYDKTSAVQGFITDSNTFLDRFDALIEGRKCKQVIKSDVYGNQLYSEDIWPE